MEFGRNLIDSSHTTTDALPEGKDAYSDDVKLRDQEGGGIAGDLRMGSQIF